jgi:hypothetical protein
MMHRLTGMPHPPQHAALGDAIPSSELGDSCPAAYTATNAGQPQALDDPTFSAAGRAPISDELAVLCHVYEQGRVQFESPQADHNTPNSTESLDRALVRARRVIASWSSPPSNRSVLSGIQVASA